MQPADVVANKPFKSAVKAACRDHFHELYEAHLARATFHLPILDGATQDDIKEIEEARKEARVQASVLFKPVLTMGALKPFIASWVKTGIAALSKPLMVEAVTKCFAVDAFLTEMHSPELYASATERARALLPVEALAEPVVDIAPSPDRNVVVYSDEESEDLDDASNLSLLSF